jgi:hypothetical protein
MTKSNYPLRLQTSLLGAVRRLAERDGASVNQFINVAVAEKLSAMETAKYFRERAQRANIEETLRLLDEMGSDEPPRLGDEIEEPVRKKASRSAASAKPSRRRG